MCVAHHLFANFIKISRVCFLNTRLYLTRRLNKQRWVINVGGGGANTNSLSSTISANAAVKWSEATSFSSMGTRYAHLMPCHALPPARRRKPHHVQQGRVTHVHDKPKFGYTSIKHLTALCQVPRVAQCHASTFVATLVRECSGWNGLVQQHCGGPIFAMFWKNEMMEFGLFFWSIEWFAYSY